MAEDKRTIGVTEAADAVLAVAVEQGHFADGIDAAKFAMAIAINAGAGEGKPHLTAEGANTKWNVGSFDPDGQLRALLTDLHPDVNQPYRLLEFLIDDGLRRVGEHIASEGELDVVALLDWAKTDPGPPAP